MIMEWENQEQQQHHHQNQNQNQRESVNVNMNNGGVMYVKVMTDEQLETLRKQIAVYASICEQLVEMHKNLTAQQDLAAGSWLGNLYCDPLMTSAGHKISARQRWTPTPLQLQILERIFDQGTGTPSKQKIKEITSELSQHGQISETNVYNWFQNRRARSKRKQLVASSNNNAESEVETEVESPNEKKIKPENLVVSQQNPAPRAEDLMCFQNPEITSEMHFLGVLSNPNTYKYNGRSIIIDNSENLNDTHEVIFIPENATFHSRVKIVPLGSGDDHLYGKMGVPGSYNIY